MAQASERVRGFMRHEVFHSGVQAMRMAARAGSPRWSVRALSTMNDAQVRAFARDAAGARIERALRDATRRLPGELLAMLILDEDAQPAVLLPLMLRRWRGLRVVSLAQVDDGEQGRAFMPLCRSDLALSALESRAMLRAIFSRLPQADLFVLRPPRKTVPSGCASFLRLVAGRAFALTWRGLVHLLARHGPPA